jgi:hypothetical protein
LSDRYLNCHAGPVAERFVNLKAIFENPALDFPKNRA